MSLVDSPDPDYLQKGGPSEKKAPWLRRYGGRLTLILLNLILVGVVIAAALTRPDLFQTYGGIKGRVVNAQGSPLSKARVFVSSAQRWVTVDAGGRFAMDRIPTGQTLVLVVTQSKIDTTGGTPLSQAVMVSAGQTADLGQLVLLDGP